MSAPEDGPQPPHHTRQARPTALLPSPLPPLPLAQNVEARASGSRARLGAQAAHRPGRPCLASGRLCRRTRRRAPHETPAAGSRTSPFPQRSRSPRAAERGSPTVQLPPCPRWSQVLLRHLDGGGAAMTRRCLCSATVPSSGGVGAPSLPCSVSWFNENLYFGSDYIWCRPQMRTPRRPLRASERAIPTRSRPGPIPCPCPCCPWRPLLPSAGCCCRKPLCSCPHPLPVGRAGRCTCSGLPGASTRSWANQCPTGRAGWRRAGSRWARAGRTPANGTAMRR